MYTMPVLDIGVDEARKIFDLNIWSLVTVRRAFVPLLLGTPKSKIVDNISVVAYTSPPAQAVYNAFKAAANSITKTLRLESQPLGVQVVALITGGVESNIENNREQGTLPEDSVYRVVSGGISKMKETKFESMDGDLWAAQIARNLSRETPSRKIWKGSNPRLVRLASVLPTRTLDDTFMKMNGLDEVEKALAR